MSNLIENRHIRIFISSTFRDMQDERDCLMKKTFPRLRMLAAKREVTLTELDLRWGITQEESESGKVVEICLREIENSIPFFIGIIGDRYGWVPSMGDFDPDIFLRYSSVEGYVECELSVTEMEMQFGVLERPENMHAFFYIKSQSGEQDQPEKIERLKDCVRANGRYPVSDYSDIEDLSEKVESAFMGLLDELFPENSLAGTCREEIEQRAFRNSLCMNYIRYGESFEALDGWLRGSNTKPMVITAESGIGKSSLVANWTRSLDDEGSCYNAIYFFIGNGSGESSHTYIAKYLCTRIRSLYGFDGDDLEHLFFKVETSGDKPLLIVLDAVNQMADIDDAKLLNWLPVTNGRIRFLFSTLEDDRTMSVFRNRNYPVLRLSPLDVASRRDMASAYLKSFAKKLNDGQLTAVVSCPLCSNTLVLKTILDELVNFGYHELLDAKIDGYLHYDSIRDFYQKILKDYEEDYGKDSVRSFLSLTAASRNGLAEEEILSITGARQLEWSRFYCSFKSHMSTKGSLIYFSHGYILDAVRERYLKDEADEMDARSRLVSFFSNTEGVRNLDEIPFQLFRTGRLPELHQWLMDIKHAVHIIEKDENEFVQYWKALYGTGHSLADYSARLSDPSSEDRPFSKFISLCIEYFSDYESAGILCSLYSKALAEGYGTDDENDEKLYLWQGILERSLSHYDKALEQFQLSLDAMRRRRGDNHINVSFALKHIGTIYNELRDYAKADDYYRRALALQEAANKDKEVIDTLHSMADNCLDAEDFGRAEELLSKAMDNAIALLGDNNTTVSSLLNSLSALYDDTGRFTESIEASKKSIEMDSHLLGIHHINLAHSFHNLAGTYCHMKDLARAEECYERALDIKRELFGPDHYETALTEAGLANVKKALGDYNTAAELHKKYLEAYLRTIGDGPEYVSVIYNGIGEDYYLMEDYPTALHYHQMALDTITSKVAIVPSPYYNAIGNDLFSMDRYFEALEYYRKGLSAAESEHDRYGESIFLNCIGDSYGFLGEFEKALESFRKAYEIRQELFTDDDPRVIKCRDNIDKALSCLS